MGNIYLTEIFWYLILTTVPTIRTFGFDSANSCSSPKMNRNGRAQILATIPCDLTQQAYCNLPGASYPWHAVRRFVHENQGLMKRMYGDVRHISVLRDEIQNNDIDSNDMEVTAARYSYNGNFRQKKFLHSGMQNVKDNDVMSEPHFRPMMSSTASPTTTTATTSTTAQTGSSTEAETVPTLSLSENTTSSVISSSTESSASSDFNTKKFDDRKNYLIDDSPDHNLESNSILDVTTVPAAPSDINSENIRIVQAPNLLNHQQNKTESATISTTLRVVQQIIKSEMEIETAAEIQRIENQTADLISETIDRIDGNVVKDLLDDTKGTILVGMNETEDNDNVAEKLEASNRPAEETAANVKEIFVEKKKYNRPVTSTNTMEGQLFQDTVQKENPLPNNVRGVNACPVKEEVVAPFWANNTRGEVLALLNLYPFEQYVHWEKCTHENKQMYCRQGCRCEQQYRLHRLLAYDPHNECRGIFSDWFRFPSCCICKCYDIPSDFRVTSRSPRTSLSDGREDDVITTAKRHPIDIAEDFVKQAIYEHATDDWYRPSDDLDLYN